MIQSKFNIKGENENGWNHLCLNSGNPHNSFGYHHTSRYLITRSRCHLCCFNFIITFSSLVIEEDGLYGFLNEWNMSIIFFLIALGIITGYIVLSGGATAFTKAIIRRVQTREGVQYTAAILGILIFVDDYFNALVVGNVSKPLAEAQKVSRARLAYIVDSTSAPICVISPISSWATGIMGSMAVILAGAGISYSAFSAFLMTIPYHFYVITTLIMVFVVIRFNLNLGLMKKYEADT